MKVKTEELSGVALDWAVAMVEGYGAEGTLKADSRRVAIPHPDGGTQLFRPSTHWVQGGQIIHARGISVLQLDDSWWATCGDPRYEETMGYTGSTPLVAAMRSLVASELGDEVDVPEHLL